MLGLHLIKIFPHCQKEKKKHKKQAKEKETTKVSKAMKMLCLMKKKGKFSMQRVSAVWGRSKWEVYARFDT